MSQNLRLSAIILTGALTLSANATQLISNGDFQNPLAEPWIITGATSIVGEHGGLSAMSVPGNRYANMGGFGYDIEGITQTVDFGAVAGDASLAFDLQWIDAEDPNMAFLDITIGSTLVQRIDLGDTNFLGITPLARRTYNVGAFMGTGAQDVKFFIRKDTQTQFSVFIDNVSLAARPVPEPATMTVLGFALAAMLRRRKSA
jgi:hypothetical protein